MQPITEPEKIFIHHNGRAGAYRIACHFWLYQGKEAQKLPPLIAIHGLTRNGRDFDTIARGLSHYCDVYCPDMPGRGDSDWLNIEDYTFEHYVSIITKLVEHQNIEKCNWLGTSMGGILGMVIASMQPDFIQKLILNDIGSIIPKSALETIGHYAGRAPLFENLQNAEQYFRKTCQETHPMSDEDFFAYTQHGTFKRKDGKYQLKLDPNIGERFRLDGVHEDINLQPFWNDIKCPTLIIRGGKSKLFPQEVFEDMIKSKQRTETHLVAEAGHVPSIPIFKNNGF